MSAGPSLYRRHRPRGFADVVGQEHVVRTLRHAVEQDKVHHAYLFVGSRGTGKTSMAKILAAALNCQSGPPGPTTEPCGTCDSCVAIAAATSLDVIEMDAASNNSVDDIRELRESVQFAPVTGGHKVYILDEAHMLSTAAWNAFLKTLEEPPPSTVFVLATTEAHKIMDTVVDRCHRFDFARPTSDQLASVVRRVAEQESIAIGPDAVALLARHAAGSYRDALGTLEQLRTYSADGSTVTVGDVIAVLGVADDDLLFGAMDAVALRSASQAWRIAASLADSGRDAGRFLRDLEAHARDLLVVQTLEAVPTQLAMTAERDARLVEQADRCTGSDVIRTLDLLAGAQRLAKDGADAQTQLELALVKAASPASDPTIKALQARIERLESAAPATAPVPVRPPASASPPDLAVPAGATAPAGGPDAGPARSSDPGSHPEPEPEHEAAGAEPESGHLPAQVAVADPSGLDLALVQELWPAVLAALNERLPALVAGFADCQPTAVDGRSVTIGVPPGRSFQRRRMESAESRRALAEAFNDLTGIRPSLSYSESDELEHEARPAMLSEDELVARLKSEFDAQEIEPESDNEGGTPMTPQPNMKQMLAQVQRMQAEMAKAQEQLKSEQVEASAGGGAVTVTVSGELVVKSITIDPAAIDPDDPDLLGDMVLAAVNEGLRQAQELAASRMGAATGGLDPGSLGLPGL